MKTGDRGSLIVALFLIGLGALFLVFNLVPGLSLGRAWPVIVLLIAAGFFLPPLIWEEWRVGLVALFIPGSVLGTAGLIFFYNTLTDDWISWAYAWLLIPAAAGFGIALASRIGKWDQVVTRIGRWVLGLNLAAFSFFAAFFGRPFMKVAGAVALLGGGVWLVLREARGSKVEKPQEMEIESTPIPDPLGEAEEDETSGT